jgi:ERCC4-type nuclease
MEIIVDDREKAVIPFLEEFKNKYNIIYKIQRNQTGDYAIVYKDEILLIIERKTWTDLAASMRDGRKENVKKLLNLREETKCNLAYLIEGDATPSFTKKYGRLPVKNLRAHLDHLMFRDNIHIIYSKNEIYTAERLFELATNYLSNKEIIKKITSKKGGNILDNESKEHGELSEYEYFKNDSFLTKMINASDEIYACTSEQQAAERQALDQKTTDQQTDEQKTPGQQTDEQKTTDTHADKQQSDGPLVDKQQSDGPLVDKQQSDGPLVDKQQSDGPLVDNVTEIKGQDLLKVKQNIELAIDQQLLLCLPCVGSCTAPLLSENNVSLYSIYHQVHDWAYVANIKYNTGAVIGIPKAKKIIDCVLKINESRYNKTRVKILSSIPLISKKTAESILKQIKLTDILDETLTISELANIKKTEKTKLGNAAASNIIKYLINSN